MKRTAITLTLLIALIGAQAQNFNPIRSNRISFFKQDGENFILGLQVDSVTISGDSTFYHFHKTWDYQKATGHGYGEDECVLPNGPSWLGHNAVELSDGRFLFTNYLKDTITLKPYAEIDVTWSAFTFLNGDILWATVDSIYTEEILGVVSQLKEISFLRKDSDGSINPDFPSNLQVVISDSLGMVTTFPFRSLVEFDSNAWPNKLLENYALALNNFHIVGLTNPNVGKSLISNISIYDFDIGDEFHYIEDRRDGIGDGNNFVHQNTKRISKVLNKTYNETSLKIIYTWDNVQLYKASGTQNGEPFNETEYKEYESTSSISLSDTIYYLPEKAYYNEWEGNHYIQLPHSYNRMRVIPIEYPIIGNFYEGCWQIFWPFGSMGRHGLGEGLGDLGFWYDNETNDGDISLVHYKKGAQTWGTPLVISSVPTINTSTISFYPNPVHSGESITISAPSDSEFYSITLINMSGITLKQEKGLQGQQLWQIPSRLPADIYILRVSNSNGEIYTTRLAIH